MNLDYISLLERISEEQQLGLQYDEIPVRVETDIASYWLVHIIYEDDNNLVIITPGENGEEYIKILNKSTILSISLIYAQMLTEPKDSKGDVSYV